MQCRDKARVEVKKSISIWMGGQVITFTRRGTQKIRDADDRNGRWKRRKAKYHISGTCRYNQLRSLPRNRTVWPYFCSLVIKASPCLTTSAYCLFLSSGRLVSMIPLTRSIVHEMRSLAMNLARSLILLVLFVEGKIKTQGRGLTGRESQQ